MNTKKMILILSLALFTIGITLCFGAILVTGFDFEKLNSGEVLIEKEYSTPVDSIQSITINDSNKNVIVKPSDDEQIHIQYFDNDKEHYTFIKDNNSLSVKYKNKVPWYKRIFLFSFQFHTEAIILSIPINYAGNIKVSTSNSDIDISRIRLTGNLTLNTSNGKIINEDIVLNGNISADTSNGRIEFSNVNLSGEVLADTSNAKIIMENIVGKAMNLDTSNASIEISHLDISEKVFCTTSNGNIKGNIKGMMNDFNIISKTSNGDNNLPTDSTGGVKNMRIKTSNGNINFNFYQ